MLTDEAKKDIVAKLDKLEKESDATEQIEEKDVKDDSTTEDTVEPKADDAEDKTKKPSGDDGKSSNLVKRLNKKHRQFMEEKEGRDADREGFEKRIAELEQKLEGAGTKEEAMEIDESSQKYLEDLVEKIYEKKHSSNKQKEEKQNLERVYTGKINKFREQLIKTYSEHFDYDTNSFDDWGEEKLTPLALEFQKSPDYWLKYIDAKGIESAVKAAMFEEEEQEPKKKDKIDKLLAKEELASTVKGVNKSGNPAVDKDKLKTRQGFRDNLGNILDKIM